MVVRGCGQKVVITGFNGIGKSTLLKTLIGQLPALHGQFKFSAQVTFEYFEQDLVWDDDITSVAKDRKAPSGGKSRTREADDAAIFA